MITVLCSASGSPGVTTTALAATLNHPSPGLLVDVDRDPSQAVLAGWLGGCQPRGRGVVPLVQERSSVDDLSRFTLELGQQGHLFLPGFSIGANVSAFSAAWGQLARILRTVSTSDTRVIVDAGRIGAAGLPLPLLEVADTVALVCRSSLRSLVAARLAAPLLKEARRAGLIVIAPDAPYSAADATEALHLPLLGVIPADVKAASVVSDGLAPHRRYEQSPAVAAWRTLAQTLEQCDEAAA